MVFVLSICTNTRQRLFKLVVEAGKLSSFLFLSVFVRKDVICGVTDTTSFGLWLIVLPQFKAR